MNSAQSEETFVDTNVFGGIYFYSYVLIFLVIVAGAYYFAGKVRLYYESYKALQDIEEELGIATLGIKALEIKYNIAGKGEKQRKKNKVEHIKITDVKQELNKRFNNVYDIVERHRQQLENRINEIEQEQTQMKKNDINVDDEKQPGNFNWYVNMDDDIDNRTINGNNNINLVKKMKHVKKFNKDAQELQLKLSLDNNNNNNNNNNVSTANDEKEDTDQSVKNSDDNAVSVVYVVDVNNVKDDDKKENNTKLDQFEVCMRIFHFLWVLFGFFWFFFCVFCFVLF